MDVNNEIIRLLQEMTADLKADNDKAEEQMNINGKAVDVASLSIDGVDTQDYPDFVDAYYEAGEFKDGTELTEDELDYLRDAYPEHLNMMAFEHYL